MNITLTHNYYYNRFLKTTTQSPKLQLCFSWKQFYISKTDWEAIPHAGFCTWSPFRLRWWPDKHPGWKVGLTVHRSCGGLS